ncbi:bifunctional UDP-N-acetylglucosamine diphosphorylase/glucosamine-1-phosphate N-acetyltransferase GlmU [Pullulanibacillus sp. KACC 23026]|uniref:bifunctional UDP-N-acetylglucosamine diphosphorylase/glucosamine-1-phosphate N-acetyltransferase GlmU n=1 Tax=Pullulanibacillus sp. KACC 23026 TaxID=3028315 RepID=UPI0023B0E7C0|nr:bifunctional UDP-N-acetylglucosamine diphosphorylase/glucosamine-1-phosphate N-acetyltransferase GlmU [Pullulanibacillus sp. KACC 23026]WEG12732.1 bifunctional UDP-N-acetylglucosamine diphosphorylase/glucosamine-1-phosphate N-acetyltransferase GlmU [Pullulanibacillus sp. KACC 23026]
MINTYAIILAAGLGTRMKSKLYKVLHPVCGKPMVEHIVDQVEALNLDKIVTVIGHGAEKVKEKLGDRVEFCLQEEQLGTGHAVMQAEVILGHSSGTTVILCGDTPLISKETLAKLIQSHKNHQDAATILTAITDNPTGYGRIIRNAEGNVERIVEEKDANDAERSIKEVSTGLFCFDNEKLFAALKRINNDNAQGEFYLPDVIEILQGDGETIHAVPADSFDETLGVNDRLALSQAEAYMRNRLNRKHMQEGVTILDPSTTYIDADVKIARDVVIYPGTILKGQVSIEEDCVIGPNTEIKDSQIGKASNIKMSVVHDSTVGEQVNIGPFAHIRPLSHIGNHAKIGNFVEIKKSTMGEGSKASHLSYVGDAEVGRDVNLGCGSITVNYDGTNKHLTKIGDGSFIGCNVNLIAPVTIGDGAFVAAGSTITDDVDQEALAIARERQTNKPNYAKKLKPKKK